MKVRAAILTSLIFALHPIHTEAVAGITGRADALACLLMLISFLLYHKVLSLSSPEKRVECQIHPEMRESEKCRSKSNSVEGSINIATGNQSRFDAELAPKSLDLNDNGYLKCRKATLPNSTFLWSKSNAVLFASGLVGCAAMLAKETGITILGINLLYDLHLHLHLFISSSTHKNMDKEENQVDKNKSFHFLQTERLEKLNSKYCHQGSLRKRLCFLISLIFLSLSIRLALMNGEFPIFGRPDNPTAYSPSEKTRLLTYAYLPIFNFILVIYPRTLSYDWQMGSIPLVETIWDTRNFSTFAIYITMFFAVQKGLNSTKHKNGNVVLAVALLFTVIPHLPASNLLFSVGFVVAERVLYIPSLGICILIVHGLESINKAIETQFNNIYPLKILSNLCTWACICSLLVSFGLRTWQRNAVWQSRLTLFTSGMQDVPHNAKMHYNFANLQKDLEQRTSAIEHYTMAIKLWPEYASAHNNLGTLLMGNPAEAEHHFLRAIQAANQAHGGAHFNLSVLYMQNEKYLQATSHLKKSLVIDPSNREAMEYLSTYYSMIHSQKGKKLRNDGYAMRNSTSDTLNVTTANKFDFLTSNKTNHVMDVVSKNTEFWI